MKRTIKMKVLSGILCLALVLTTVMVQPQDAYAAGDEGRYNQKVSMSKAYPGIKKIAEAYVVGSNGVANSVTNSGATVNAYILPEGTKIQGQTIDKKYLDRNNLANLKELQRAYQGGADSVPWPGSDVDHKETDGSKLAVVAYDDKYVIFWSDGFKAWTEIGLKGCVLWKLMLSHTPGFYAVKRSDVWLNTYDEANEIPEGENVKIASQATVISDWAEICAIPGKSKNVLYRVSEDTIIDLVSTEKISSQTKGDKKTYYKIAFKGKNAVSYLGTTGYYYIASDDVVLGVKETASNIRVYDIVDNDILVTWDVNNTTWNGQSVKYKVEVVTYKTERAVASETVNTNQFTIKRDWFDQYLSPLEIRVAIDYGNGKFQNVSRMVPLISPYTTEGYVEPFTNTAFRVSGGDIYKLQYSVNADMSDAVVIESEEPITMVKGLKKNTTYYVQFATGRSVNTDNGPRVLCSSWSMVFPIPTNNITVKKPTIGTVSAISKGMKVKWSQPSGYIDGYQVRIATDSEFKKNVKTYKVTSPSKLSKEIKNLKSNKTYYVKVRAYYTLAEDEYFYSGWSKVKKIKTKS